MPKLALYNQDGEQVGEVNVNTGLFEAPIKKGALYQTAMAQSARRRQGTAAVRDRSEVRGGGSKPWVQKGTGRARHGSIRSPLWVGGGVIFGPHPRNYSFRVPKKVRRAALCSVLTAKLREDKLLIVDKLAVSEPKTKAMVEILSKLNALKSALIVMSHYDKNIDKSVRNLPRVSTITARQLNVLDILKHDCLVMSKEALEKVEEVFGG